MQASIKISADPGVRYLLRIGDSCLVLAQRLAEWCGHAPMLEEDIALSNMALDLVGQARAVLTWAGQLEGEALAASGGPGRSGFDEDQLAFLRDERDFMNFTIVELPRGDFAFTMLRNFMLSTFFKLLWQRLLASNDAELAAIAGKAVKESRYHQQHAGDWVVRLADGTAESTRRLQAALDELWPYAAEMFESDAVEAHAEASGLGPAWSSLQGAWRDEAVTLLTDSGLELPAERAFRSTGKLGRHSEHLGYVLAEMQHLQRTFPGGVW